MVVLISQFSDDLPSGSPTDSVSTPPRALRSSNRAISTPSGTRLSACLDGYVNAFI